MDLSIVIVSYNTKKIIFDCISSIIKNTKKIRYEIIVVDNASVDGSIELLSGLAEKEPLIRFIEAGENHGFGKANNLGSISAKGKYLLFLNSDTLIVDNAIGESVHLAKRQVRLGVFSCQLVNADQSPQASGGYFPNLLNLYAWQFGLDDLPLLRSIIHSFHPHISNYKNRQKLDWVTGAFMIVPRAIFQEAGGFDEQIFMYTEEMELCYRISQLGYRIVYKNKPSIIHLGGASGGSHLALTNEVKYMIYFWKKHFPSWQLPLVKFAFLIGSLLRWLLFGIIKGDAKSRRTYLEAIKLAI